MMVDIALAVMLSMPAARKMTYGDSYTGAAEIYGSFWLRMSATFSGKKIRKFYGKEYGD